MAEDIGSGGGSGLGITTGGQQGAWYIAEHLVRKVKIYPMTESELDSINLLNSISAGALSGAAFLGGIYASVWWDVKTAAAAGNQATRTLGDPIMEALFWGAAACIVVAIWAKWSKGSTFDRMVRESFVMRDGETHALAPRSGMRARCQLAWQAIRGRP